MLQIRGYHDRLLSLRCRDFVLQRAHGLAAQYIQRPESSSAAGHGVPLDFLAVANSTFDGTALVGMSEAVHLMM